MSTITVDGCDYEVEHTEHGLERIVVWDVDTDLVGDVALDHNLECAFADIGRGGESVNYFEFDAMPTDDIARWIVCTAE